MLYLITAPTLQTPTYCVGLEVARKVLRGLAFGQMTKVPDPPAPPVCLAVEVRGFKLEFLPQTLQMVLNRLEQAELVDEYFKVSTDRDCLYVSWFVLGELIKKLKRL